MAGLQDAKTMGISMPIITTVDTDFTIILRFGLFCLKTHKIYC